MVKASAQDVLYLRHFFQLVCTAKCSAAALCWEDRDHAISQGKGEEVVLGWSRLCMES